MKQFVEAHGGKTNCDMCQRKIGSKDKACLILDTDSMVVVCERCGSFLWEVLESLMIYFASAVQKAYGYGSDCGDQEGVE